MEMVSNLRFRYTYMSDRDYSIKQNLTMVLMTVIIICEVPDVNEE
jgi:hypothetical protein